MRTLIKPTVAMALLAIAAPSPAQTSRPTSTIWNTSEGEMKLPTSVENGREIKAPYSQDGGRILGKFIGAQAQGVVLSGYWVEDSSGRDCQSQIDGSRHWGKIIFQFNPEYTSFEGKWGYCGDNPGIVWNGTNTGSGFSSKPALDIEAFDSLTGLVDRLRTEARRAGPMPAGSGSADYTDADIAKMTNELMTMGIFDEDLQILIDDYFGTGAKFDAGKWSGFTRYAKRRFVNPDQQRATKELERNLQDALGLSQDQIDYLHERFFENDALAHDVMTQIYGHAYHSFALSSLVNDHKLAGGLSDESKARLRAIIEPEPAQGPVVRPREPGDKDVYARDCSYNAVLERMKRADPSFSIKYAVFVVYGSAISLIGPGANTGIQGGGTAVRRDVLVAGVREAIKQCERNRNKI